MSSSSSRIGQAAVSACRPTSASSSSSSSAAVARRAQARAVHCASSSHRRTSHARQTSLAPSRRQLSNTAGDSSSTPTSAPPLPSSSSSTAPRGRLPVFARQAPAPFVILRPAPESALAALAARLGLLPPGTDEVTRARRLNLVARACTHPSLGELWNRTREARRVAALADARASGLSGEQAAAKAEEEAALPTPPSHTVQATLGNALLGMLGAEALHTRYPHLPTRVLKAALSAHVGPSTAADVGVELGLGARGILRWDKDALIGGNADPKKGPIVPARPLLMKDVAAQATRALVAVIFQELGMASLRTFLSSRFLSRLPIIQSPTSAIASSSSSPRIVPPSPSAHVSLAPLLKFSNPKRVLSETCAKHGQPRPVSRLLAETGRRSIAPVFVVGVYSAHIKLGEGTGSSLRMAEFRAAEDALRRLYLTQADLSRFALPSTTLDDEYAPASLPGAEGRKQQIPFRPAPLGTTEVLHESRS